MSDTPAVPLPPSYDWGLVVGRSISAMADTVEDWDRYPEARGSNGRVTFTPHTRYKKELSSPTAFVHFEVVTARIVDGKVVDAQGSDGIYLISGAYKVSFTIDSGSIPGFDILVTPNHTSWNPLDLVTAAPFVPEEGTPVTTVVIPAGAAEEQVLAWRNGRLVWVNIPAEAEAAAARAEAAASSASSSAASAAASVEELSEELKPEFTWSDTRLVIDGVPGPNLKGEKGDAPQVLTGSGAQLNNLTVFGSYRLSSGNDGSTANNFPVDKGPNPIVIVDPWGTKNNVIQTVKYPRDHGVWMRGYYGGVWQTWQNIGPNNAGERLAALEYDSGLLNVTALAPHVTSGNLWVQRLGNETWLIADGLRLGADVAGSNIDILPVGTLPIGYRAQRTLWKEIVTNAGARRRIALTASGWVPLYGSPAEGDTFHFTLSFPTPGPIPTTHPGDPA